MQKTLQTSEFWMTLLLAIASVAKPLGFPQVEELVKQYGAIVVGLILQRVLSKTLKPGQAPFRALAVVGLGALLLCGQPVRAVAAEPVLKAFAGVNGAWFDGPGTAFPADLEAGVNGRASLEQHLSLVAAGYYGFDHSYFRGSSGFRLTPTDDSSNFSVGIGAQYQISSQTSLKANQWEGEAVFGWRPAPQFWPHLYTVGQGGWGLKSKTMSAYLGLRYEIARGFYR